MHVRVIVPPEPIVSPAEIEGAHAPDDAGVAALIQAVTETIDGPGGWLGRSLGPQTLELTLNSWDGCSLRLPCGPVIEVEKIEYRDAQEIDHELVVGDIWKHSGHVGGWTVPALSARPGAIRITYRAGYDGETTGIVPERARQAIILSAQHLRSVGAADPFLRVDEVEGIGRREYSLTEQAGRVVTRACENLLSTLRVYSL